MHIKGQGKKFPILKNVNCAATGKEPQENMSKITFFEGKKNIQTLSCQGNNTKPTSELV